jgi:hypothetical protein
VYRITIPNGLLSKTGDVTFPGSSSSNLRRNRANTSGTLSARNAFRASDVSARSRASLSTAYIFPISRMNSRARAPSSSNASWNFLRACAQHPTRRRSARCRSIDS